MQIWIIQILYVSIFSLLCTYKEKSIEFNNLSNLNNFSSSRGVGNVPAIKSKLYDKLMCLSVILNMYLKLLLLPSQNWNIIHQTLMLFLPYAGPCQMFVSAWADFTLNELKSLNYFLVN